MHVFHKLKWKILFIKESQPKVKQHDCCFSAVAFLQDFSAEGYISPNNLEVYWKNSKAKQEKFLKCWSFEKEVLSFNLSPHLKR